MTDVNKINIYVYNKYIIPLYMVNLILYLSYLIFDDFMNRPALFVVDTCEAHF